jgi:outer membrane protein
MRGLIRAALLALVVGAASAGSLSAQAAAAPKIGFVNSQQLYADAPGRTEAENRLKTELSTFQAQLQRMDDSLQAMVQQFERDMPKLDSATRMTRAKTIQDRQTAYQGRARMMDSTMQVRQAELIRPVMENVQKVIEQVRAEEGYAMIFDVASQSGVVVAADKNLDLTQKVLAKVKAAGPPKPTTGANPLTPQPAGVTPVKR